MATRLGLAQKPLRRAVVVSKNQRVLEKFVVHDHGLKFLFGHKGIFLAVLFAATRRARGVRDREIQIMNHLEQFIHQRGFARAGRRRNNVDDAHSEKAHSNDVHSNNVHSKKAHSRFCTCSRDFSISDFISRPISVTFKASPAKPEVFESMVLASRFISWSRKSIFLPTSPLWSSKPRKCLTCAFSRTSSSWMSLRSTSTATSCKIRSLSTCAPKSSATRACNRSE